jgi:hypothetical protein
MRMLSAALESSAPLWGWLSNYHLDAPVGIVLGKGR